MQDISTTLKGRIGSDPLMKHVKGNTCVTTFRLAITRWRFRSEAQPGSASYVEDGAYWYTIETWDMLAENVFRSCRKGDPVVVVARPVPNGWIDAGGQIRSSIVFRASAVGHDLARGTAQFSKNQVHGLAEQPAAGSQGDPFSTRPGRGTQDRDDTSGTQAGAPFLAGEDCGEEEKPRPLREANLATHGVEGTAEHAEASAWNPEHGLAWDPRKEPDECGPHEPTQGESGANSHEVPEACEAGEDDASDRGPENGMRFDYAATSASQVI